MVIARSGYPVLMWRAGVHQKIQTMEMALDFRSSLPNFARFLWNKKLTEALTYAGVLASATASGKP